MLKSRSHEFHHAQQTKMVAFADKNGGVFDDEFDEMLNIVDENENVQEEFEQIVANVRTQLLKRWKVVFMWRILGDKVYGGYEYLNMILYNISCC